MVAIITYRLYYNCIWLRAQFYVEGQLEHPLLPVFLPVPEGSALGPAVILRLPDREPSTGGRGLIQMVSLAASRLFPSLDFKTVLKGLFILSVLVDVLIFIKYLVDTSGGRFLEGSKDNSTHLRG